MEELTILRKIRMKENKTKEDEMMLKYHRALSFISEILVEESKSHLSSEKAIIKIREYMNENQ